jgi:hypothetical protein
MKYIEAKAEGRKPKLVAMPRKKAPKSLADMLAASLNAAGKPQGEAVA